MDRETTIALASHWARVFMERVNDFVALAMVFGLACWAMWNGTPIGAYIAAGFAFFAYLWCRLSRGDRNAKTGRKEEPAP